jgi:hypothetical protein
MYYEKISLVYGQSSSGRAISPDYPLVLHLDIQTKIDEFRIVGSKGRGLLESQVLKLEMAYTANQCHHGNCYNCIMQFLDLMWKLQFRVQGINSASGYNGQYVVAVKL